MPMFEIFLPNFLKKGDDPGKFRQLDDIMFINGYPGYLRLLSLAEKSMQVVCEVKGGHVVHKIRKIIQACLQSILISANLVSCRSWII